MADWSDIAIVNGRVMDPESSLDAVRNVGVNGDKIATITEDEISGKQTLDAAGFFDCSETDEALASASS